jgi:hypothetical protein
MTPRAFTLLETLLAAVLLAAMSATCAGVLRLARSEPEPRNPRVSIDELADLADRALRSPSALGLPAIPHDGLPRWTAIPWPDAPDRSPVRVEVIPSSAHAWIVFSSEDLTVSRWVRTPEPAP